MYFIIYIFCNKFQQSRSLRRKPFTVDVMVINGNVQQIQVCNLLILNTKNVAWLNWHVPRHLTKKIEISPKKCANLTKKKIGGGGGGLATLQFNIAFIHKTFNDKIISPLSNKFFNKNIQYLLYTKYSITKTCLQYQTNFSLIMIFVVVF